MPAFQKSIVNHQALGSIYSGNFCDLIKVPFGKGNFYIHCNPIVFSNYFQVEKNNIEYTSKVLSYLEPGDIIWDENSKTTYNSEFQNNEQQQEGPLKFNFIANFPALGLVCNVDRVNIIYYFQNQTNATINSGSGTK